MGRMAVRRVRYRMPETIAPLSDDPLLDLPWLERIPIRLNRLTRSNNISPSHALFRGKRACPGLDPGWREAPANPDLCADSRRQQESRLANEQVVRVPSTAPVPHEGEQ